MNSSTIDYVGISGGIITVVSVMIFVVKKFLHSRCIRGADGALHLDVSLNSVMQQTQDIKTIIEQLRSEITQKVENNQTVVVSNTVQEV